MKINVNDNGEMTNKKYYYSASENMFIVTDEMSEIKVSDAVEVDKLVYDEMSTLSPDLILASNNDGQPISVPTGTYYYCAKDNAFYPYVMQSIYVKAGSWPKTGMQVAESVYQEFSVSEPPSGKQRGAKNGLPVWIDIPEPTKEEFIYSAEQNKKILLADATNTIAPLQDAVDLGIAIDTEITALTEWKTYRVQLNRVDITTAPDIDWPVKPE